jgi:hypothetical protein
MTSTGELIDDWRSGGPSDKPRLNIMEAYNTAQADTTTPAIPGFLGGTPICTGEVLLYWGIDPGADEFEVWQYYSSSWHLMDTLDADTSGYDFSGDGYPDQLESVNTNYEGPMKIKACEDTYGCSGLSSDSVLVEGLGC